MDGLDAIGCLMLAGIGACVVAVALAIPALCGIGPAV
jgi:hypothetical protein